MYDSDYYDSSVRGFERIKLTEKTRGLPETLFRKRLKEEMKLFLTSLITAALSEVHHLEGIHKI